MHVLIVSHCYPHPLDHTSGFYCEAQASALVQAGASIGVVAPQAISIKLMWNRRSLLLGHSRSIVAGIRTDLAFFPSVPKLQRVTYWLTRHIGKLMLKRYEARYGRPDVVHVHVYHDCEVAILAKKMWGTPIVYTEHFQDIDTGLMDAFRMNLIHKLVAETSINIAVSPNFQKSLSHTLGKPFMCVPNMYDSDIFKFDANADKSEKFTFIFIGSFNHNKNQTRLLKAFKLAFGGQQVKLKIIGEGPDHGLIVRTIAELGLESQVDMMGLLSQPDVRREIQRSHVLVSASNYETFGVTIIEALACGLPVVATRSGGPDSIIDQQLPNGILTDKSDESLADGMQRVYENYPSYIPEQIAMKASQLYSKAAIAQKLLSIYDTMITTASGKELSAQPV